MLANIPRLVTAYFTGRPDPSVPAQRVAFGTSGHRGSALNNGFNEAHILSISQALCDHRHKAGIDGPLFIGIDTHALAEPALASAIEVFAANGVEVMTDRHDGYTPTPVISRAILSYNKGRQSGLADGVVISPRIIHPRMAASNTTRPMAARPIPTSLPGSSARRTAFSKLASTASSASLTRERAKLPTCIAAILSVLMSQTSPMWSTWR
jgi:alpha-D-glucose phosphate-specific phosphoglucomutase